MKSPEVCSECGEPLSDHPDDFPCDGVKLDIQQYEEFMLERPNATDAEVEARFGMTADECNRTYVDFLAENPYWSYPMDRKRS